VFELKGKLQYYFQENSKLDFAKCFENEEWLEKLAYLADIYRPIPGQVLDFCERRVPYYSQESNKLIAAVFDFLHV
jgi:hypothetical protein